MKHDWKVNTEQETHRTSLNGAHGDRAHEHEIFTEDNSEQQAERCEDALSKVLLAELQTIGICTQSTTRWNAELNER
jgi:hypothetical protein